MGMLFLDTLLKINKVWVCNIIFACKCLFRWYFISMWALRHDLLTSLSLTTHPLLANELWLHCLNDIVCWQHQCFPLCQLLYQCVYSTQCIVCRPTGMSVQLPFFHSVITVSNYFAPLSDCSLHAAIPAPSSFNLSFSQFSICPLPAVFIWRTAVSKHLNPSLLPTQSSPQPPLDCAFSL